MVPGLIGIVLMIVLFVIRILYALLIIQAVLSWLIAFELVSRRNQIVDTIWRFANALTEPLLRPIRPFMPRVSGVDLAPLALLLLLFVLERVIVLVAASYLIPV